MAKKLEINRRLILKGAGFSVALPFLEAMLPFSRPSLAADATTPRYLNFFMPNGCIVGDWKPGQAWLSPLNSLNGKYSVIQGLQNDVIAEKTTGEHCHGVSSFLTGKPLRSGNNIFNAKSADQYIADYLYNKTKQSGKRILNIARQGQGSNEDGFSGVYTGSLSWQSANSVAQKYTSTSAAFNFLFDGVPRGEQRGEDKKITNIEKEKIKTASLSRLDFIKDSLVNLKKNLSHTDKIRMDEYESSIRDLERKIANTPTDEVIPGDIIRNCPAGASPPSSNNDLTSYTKVMMDIIALALQCNQTQVVTYLMYPSFKGGSENYGGRSLGHHNLSHYQNESNKRDLRHIYKWYIGNIAYLMNKLDSVQEAGGSILDNSFLIFGAGLGDGSLLRSLGGHRMIELPILLAGGGAGTLTPNKHYKFQGESLGNFHYTCMKKIGLTASNFNGYQKTLNF